jgi:hypothetical protein
LIKEHINERKMNKVTIKRGEKIRAFLEFIECIKGNEERKDSENLIEELRKQRRVMYDCIEVQKLKSLTKELLIKAAQYIRNMQKSLVKVNALIGNESLSLESLLSEDVLWKVVKNYSK